MAIQFLALLAAPAGAAAGWLGKKALEANGRSIISAAEQIRDEGLEEIKAKKKEYDRKRKRLITKMRSFFDIVASHVDSNASINVDKNAALPAFLKKAWKHIEDAKSLPHAFPPTTSQLAEEKYQAGRVGYANHQAIHGHPVQGALLAAAATFSGGIKYRESCLKYKAEMEKWRNESVGTAETLLESLENEIEVIESDWEAIINPKLKSAVKTPKNEALLTEIYIWAKRVKEKAEKMI